MSMRKAMQWGTVFSTLMIGNIVYADDTATATPTEADQNLFDQLVEPATNVDTNPDSQEDIPPSDEDSSTD
jgi:hypothetical protein